MVCKLRPIINHNYNRLVRFSLIFKWYLSPLSRNEKKYELSSEISLGLNKIWYNRTGSGTFLLSPKFSAWEVTVSPMNTGCPIDEMTIILVKLPRLYSV